MHKFGSARLSCASLAGEAPCPDVFGQCSKVHQSGGRTADHPFSSPQPGKSHKSPQWALQLSPSSLCLPGPCPSLLIHNLSLRYPIHWPRERCYGDKDEFPGVRTYGVREPDETYDVYCYAEQMQGDLGLLSLLDTAADKV